MSGKVGLGIFDFASVSLAACSGLLSMDAYAAYLAAIRPPKIKPSKKSSRRRSRRKDRS